MLHCKAENRELLDAIEIIAGQLNTSKANSNILFSSVNTVIKKLVGQIFAGNAENVELKTTVNELSFRRAWKLDAALSQKVHKLRNDNHELCGMVDDLVEDVEKCNTNGKFYNSRGAWVAQAWTISATEVDTFIAAQEGEDLWEEWRSMAT